MLVSPFRTDKPAVLLLLLLLAPALWIRSFLVPSEVVHAAQGPFFQIVQGWLTGHHGTSIVIAVGLTVLCALLLNNTALRSGLYFERDNLTALLLPLLFALRPGELSLSPMLCAAPFIVMAFRSVWSVQHRPSVLGTLFDAGSLLGIAGLFRTDLFLLLPAIWFGVATMRPFAWREFAVPLLAVALPAYLCWGGAYVLDGAVELNPFSTFFPWRMPEMAAGIEVYFRYGVLLVLLLFGFAGSIKSYNRSVMKEKKTRNAFLGFLAVCTVIALAPHVSNALLDLELMAIPLAVLFSYALRWTRPMWLAELLFTLLLAGAFWSQWA